MDAAANRELVGLVWALSDRRLSAQDAVRLESRLHSDSEARAVYIQFIELTASLSWQHSTDRQEKALAGLPVGDRTVSPTGPTGGPTAATGGPAARSAAAKPHGAAADKPVLPGGSPVLGFLGSVWSTIQASPRTFVSLLGLGLAGYFLITMALIPLSRWAESARIAKQPGSSGGGLSAMRREAQPSAGSLATDRRARWEHDSPAAGDKHARIGKHYQLASGRAEVVLAGGARVVIEGPAGWQIASAERLLLDSGRLSAHVPKSAIGFTVVTPTAEVIDLGTDFSLIVTGGQETRLAVTQGAVKLVVLDSAQSSGPEAKQAALAPIHVAAGQAMSVSRSASGAPTAATVPFNTVWDEDLARLGDPLAFRRSRIIVHQILPPGVPGQIGFFGGVHGFDFKVLRPIRVTRLGVFDHLGDGIDPESSFTLQLWSRDDHGTDDRGDDTGNSVLGQVVVSAESPGELKFGHRFGALAKPVELPAGSYSVVAYGFSPLNPLLRPSLVPGLQVEVATSHYALVPLGWRGEKDVRPGTLPSEPQLPDHAGVTLEFEED